MSSMLAVLLTIGAALGGYLFARRFVRQRLRFVDAVRSPWAPLVAGAVAALVALPFALLPLITKTTAILFGCGAGFGTASGARALRRDDVQVRRLLP
jgi:hypothetical protein